MKRIIRLTENDLTRIVRRVIKEQSVRTVQNDETPLQTFSGGTPMDKEIIALEDLKKELEKTKKQLEFKKQVVGGRTVDRIRNYFNIRKLRKENQKLESQLKELERDIKDLESGKVLTTSQKEAIVGTIGGIITYIGVIITQMKTNFAGKAANTIKGAIDRD